jgi:hypothetical protein
VVAIDGSARVSVKTSSVGSPGDVKRDEIHNLRRDFCKETVFKETGCPHPELPGAIVRYRNDAVDTPKKIVGLWTTRLFTEVSVT